MSSSGNLRVHVDELGVVRPVPEERNTLNRPGIVRILGPPRIETPPPVDESRRFFTESVSREVFEDALQSRVEARAEAHRVMGMTVSQDTLLELSQAIAHSGRRYTTNERYQTSPDGTVVPIRSSETAGDRMARQHAQYMFPSTQFSRHGRHQRPETLRCSFCLVTLLNFGRNECANCHLPVCRGCIGPTQECSECKGALDESAVLVGTDFTGMTARMARSVRPRLDMFNEPGDDDEDAESTSSGSESEEEWTDDEGSEEYNGPDQPDGWGHFAESISLDSTDR